MRIMTLKSFKGPVFQRGMSVNQAMAAIVLVGFFATAVVKLAPAYLENNTVKSALSSLQEDYSGKDLGDISDNSIKAKLSKYFQVNQVGPEATKAVAINRVGRSVYVSVNYEIRNTFMGNIDVVLVFDNEVDLNE